MHGNKMGESKVPGRRFELLRLATYAPQAYTSASFATRALIQNECAKLAFIWKKRIKNG